MRPSTADRLLELLKSRGPLNATEAANLLGMTSAGAQQQFSRLAADALVEAEDRKSGRGRPQRYWRLTGKGHDRFPDRHGDLALELIEAIRTLFGDEGLDRLIHQREKSTLAVYRDRLSGRSSLVDRLRILASIRAAEGYMAEFHAEPTGELLLVENHCPVCAAASACRGLCRSELEIFRALLSPHADVERKDHIQAGDRRCSYRIIPRRSGDTAGNDGAGRGADAAGT